MAADQAQAIGEYRSPPFFLVEPGERGGVEEINHSIRDSLVEK